MIAHIVFLADTSVLDYVLYVAQVVLIVAGLAGLILTPIRALLRVPKIVFSPIPWQGSGPVPWTFATVEIHNKPLPPRVAWLISRETALDCTAEVEFRRRGELVVGPVAARWNDRLEPLRLQPAGEGTTWFAVYAPELVPETERRDLPPSTRGSSVAVAILRDDGTASAWGARSYGFRDWRNPEWELSRGEYEVTIRVAFADHSAESTYRLPFTKSDFAAFRLT
jgi:hypothetical protein